MLRFSFFEPHPSFSLLRGEYFRSWLLPDFFIEASIPWTLSLCNEAKSWSTRRE